MTEGRRKLSAILFTDIVGYSALSHQDESLALELLEEHRRIVRPIIEKYSGHEIKTIGDAFLLEFQSGLDAVNFAVEVQEKTEDRFSSGAPTSDLKLRIGIHLGDVVEKEGDIYGEGVNIAARLVHLSRPGGICISQSVYDQVHSHVKFPISHQGARRLKNIDQKMSIYSIELQTLDRWTKIATTFRKIKWPAVLAGALTSALAVLMVMSWVKPALDVKSKDSETPAGQPLRIAVLPFKAIGSGPQGGYVSEGITEELITQLSKMKTVRVIGRSSVENYKQTKKSPQEIGTELNVSRFIEGSVRSSGDHVRVSIQLVDSKSQEALWAQEFDSASDAVFDLQRKIAQKVMGQFPNRSLSSLPPSQVQSNQNPSVKNSAYVAYLKGRFFMNKRNSEGMLKAVEHFKEAVRLDPNFASPYASLAAAYHLLSYYEYLSPQEAVETAVPYAEKALALDPNSSEARLFFAEKAAYFDLNWKNAELKYHQAIETNPNFSTVHQWYGEFLATIGRWNEARQSINRALELDPLSLVTNTASAVIEYYARNYDTSIRKNLAIMEMDPHFVLPHYWIGRAYIEIKDYDKAVKHLTKSIEASNGSAMMKAALAYALARKGDTQAAKKLLEELKAGTEAGKKASNYDLAAVYSALGQKEEAVRSLEQAFRERSQRVADLKVDPYFDSLRTDPKFQTMIGDLRF